ncbi:MAG: flagellar biosynthesis regulator FlaF [Opitutales bacterium]|nr:flagellar biosynthesis regulator FlaF [Opitutales bacterium]
MPRNPLNAYEKVRKQTVSGREIEASVLEKGAIRLRRCQENWKGQRFDRELDEALRFNQRIWDIFNSDWQRPDNKLPKEVRQDLLSLGVFVRKTTLDIMAYPESRKLDVLIQINENLASGLRSKVEPTESSV